MNNYLEDKEFLAWLSKNKIIYNNKDTSLINALYGEFIIEKSFEDVKK